MLKNWFSSCEINHCVFFTTVYNIINWNYKQKCWLESFAHFGSLFGLLKSIELLTHNGYVLQQHFISTKKRQYKHCRYFTKSGIFCFCSGLQLFYRYVGLRWINLMISIHYCCQVCNGKTLSIFDLNNFEKCLLNLNLQKQLKQTAKIRKR